MQFGEDVSKIVGYARDEAMRTGHYGIFPDHLALGILRHSDNGAMEILRSLGVDPEDMKRRLDMEMMRPEPVPYSEMGNLGLAESTKDALNLAVLEAVKEGKDEVSSRHLLTGLCRCSRCIAAGYLAAHGISAAKLSAIPRKPDAKPLRTFPAADEIASALEAEIRSILRTGADDCKNKHFS